VKAEIVDLNTIYMIINMVKSLFLSRKYSSAMPYHVMTRIFISERSKAGWPLHVLQAGH
jgi:hypothetical protein